MSPDPARVLLAGVLGIDPTQVVEDASTATQPGWDSLAHMRLVLRLEELRGTQLAAEEILSLRSIADVARLMEGGRFHLSA